MQSDLSVQMWPILPRFIQLITHLGIHLTLGTDFGEFKKICRQTAGKSEVGPAFDLDEVRGDALNGIWMVGRGRDGKIIHTQAIKLIALPQTTLKQHLKQHSADFRVGGVEINIDESIWRLTSAAQSMSGRITYHGELWLKGGPDGIRGGSAATLLSRLMLIVAVLKWSPDYMIGIQAALTSCRGLAAREGYMRAEQGSIAWSRMDGEAAIEGWLVWMTRDEAIFNLLVSPDSFFNMLETANGGSAAAVPAISRSSVG